MWAAEFLKLALAPIATRTLGTVGGAVAGGAVGAAFGEDDDSRLQNAAIGAGVGGLAGLGGGHLVTMFGRSPAGGGSPSPKQVINELEQMKRERPVLPPDKPDSPPVPEEFRPAVAKITVPQLKDAPLASVPDELAMFRRVKPMITTIDAGETWTGTIEEDKAFLQQIYDDYGIKPHQVPAFHDLVKRSEVSWLRVLESTKQASIGSKVVLGVGGGAIGGSGDGHRTAGSAAAQVLQQQPEVGLLGKHDNDPSKSILVQPRNVNLLDDKNPKLDFPRPGTPIDALISAGYLTSREAGGHKLTPEHLDTFKRHGIPTDSNAPTFKYEPEAMKPGMTTGVDAGMRLGWGRNSVKNRQLLASSERYPLMSDERMANIAKARQLSLPETLKALHKHLLSTGEPKDKEMADYLLQQIEHGERTGSYRTPVFVGGGARGDYGATRANQLAHSPSWKSLSNDMFLVPHLGGQRDIMSPLLPNNMPSLGLVPNNLYLGLQHHGISSGNPTAQSIAERELVGGHQHLPDFETLKALKQETLERAKSKGLDKAYNSAQWVDIPSWNRETIREAMDDDAQHLHPGTSIGTQDKFINILRDPVARQPKTPQQIAESEQSFRAAAKHFGEQIVRKMRRL